MNLIQPNLPQTNLPSVLENRAAANDDPETIAAAGKEFESIFLSMMLKSMRSTVSGDGLFAGDKSDTLGGLFDLFMSQHLAKQDALGIGSMMERFIANSRNEEEIPNQSQNHE